MSKLQMDDFWASMHEAASKRKVLPISQTVLRIKNEGIMSPHLQTIRDESPIISEAFLNQMMQAAYEEGSKAVDKSSYDQGWEAAWRDVAKRLELTYE